jgi:hypothetical protein
MKKTIFFLLMFSASLTIAAQGTDFSGNWKLNPEKSKLNAEFSMAPLQLVIAQKDNDMSVERHSEFQGEAVTMTDKFTLDGKECVNTGFMDTQKKSTAVWSEDKKSLKITSKVVMDDGNEINITEVYKTDAGTLLIDSGSSSSFGDISETLVYDKM